MKDDLNWKDKRDLAIQTGLELLPYVGGALSTAYFGTKQEKRFKRLESFYQELASQIEASRAQPMPFGLHNLDLLTQLIEELNEKIEREANQQKREYFKRFFMVSLHTPVNNSNFDELRFFLETLSTLTIFECDLLCLFRHETDWVTLGDVITPSVDEYAFLGAITRLSSYGFFKKNPNILTSGPFRDQVILSGFGLRFITFCLG